MNKRPSDYKPYSKRALVFTDKAKERTKRHNRNKSQVYQNWRVQSAGLWHSLLVLDRAMVTTRRKWKAQYGHEVSSYSAKMIPVILSLSLNHSVDGSFTMGDLVQYLNPLGYSDRLSNRLHQWGVINSLVRYHFLNPLGHGIYSPTNRLRLFVSTFEKEYNAIIQSKNY